jgi:hypothetical protein
VVSEVNGIFSIEEIEYFQRHGLEKHKWSEVNLKWGEYQLYVVKGRELKWGRMWSVYKSSEVKVLVKCNWVLCSVVYWLFSIPSAFYSTSLGSTRSWVLIVFNLCSWFFYVI